MFMTLCFSGQWVETTEFNGRNMTRAILVAAETVQNSSGCIWSYSQRHAGGLFSSAAISEPAKEPPFLPPAPGHIPWVSGIDNCTSGQNAQTMSRCLLWRSYGSSSVSSLDLFPLSSDLNVPKDKWEMQELGRDLDLLIAPWHPLHSWLLHL